MTSNVPLLQWILIHAGLASIAAVGASLSYTGGIYLEHKAPAFKMMAGGWALFFVLFLIACANLSPFGLYWTLFIFACGLVGSWFRLRTGASNTWHESFFFVMSSIQAMLLWGCIILVVTPVDGINISTRIWWCSFNSTSFFYASCVAAPTLTEIIVRMIQTSQLRPGIDRHLKEGEGGHS